MLTRIKPCWAHLHWRRSGHCLGHSRPDLPQLLAVRKIDEGRVFLTAKHTTRPHGINSQTSRCIHLLAALTEAEVHVPSIFAAASKHDIVDRSCKALKRRRTCRTPA
jgi:hypothetical protein